MQPTYPITSKCSRISLLFFPLVFAVGQLYAQTHSERLDSFFKNLENYHQINGNVLIAENGIPVYKKSFGYANFELKIPNTDNTAFSLASVSKTITATAILQLKDKGKIKLDDLLKKYIPEFPYANITIRQLLSHTSGLPDYELFDELIDKNPEKTFGNKDILPALKAWNKPLRFSAGEKFSYSGMNYCLLALLVEKISGMDFPGYIQRYIFSVSRMDESYFAGNASTLGKNQTRKNYEYPFLFSSQYADADSLQRNRWRSYNASGFIGQGNIVTSTSDLLKFDNALFNGKLIAAASLNEALTPAKLNDGSMSSTSNFLGKASYGLGWFILDDSSNGKIVWHTGGQPGGLSILIHNVTKKQSIILFDNAWHKNLYGEGFNAMAILNNQPVIIYKKSLAQEYGATLAEQGIDAGFCKLQELKNDSLHYYMNESEINELGLQLLYEPKFNGHEALALEVLKLNCLLYPNSFNTYDSYGEALAKTGRKKEAIFMYKKAIALNPQNEDGKKILGDLEKK